MEILFIISERSLYSGKIWIVNCSKNLEVVLTLGNKIQYNVPCVNLKVKGEGLKEIFNLKLIPQMNRLACLHEGLGGKNMDYIKKMISKICKTKDDPETDTVRSKEMNTANSLKGFVKSATALAICGLLVVSVAAAVDDGAVGADVSGNAEENPSDDGSAPGRYLAVQNVDIEQVQSVLSNYELEETIEEWVDTVTGNEQAATEGPAAELKMETEQPTATTEENVYQTVAESKYIIDFSEEDYEVLCRIVEAEAGDQDDKGRILVANVILNRVRDAQFPDNITDVVFQKSKKTYQFSPTRPGGRYYTVEVSDLTVECVERALKGEDYSEGALYFAMKTSSKSWFNRCLEFLFKHGDHYFYKD